MKRITILLFFVLVGAGVFGQSLQWATTVIEFSSELTPGQFSAKQALGKPNVLPAGGENPNALAVILFFTPTRVPIYNSNTTVS